MSRSNRNIKKLRGFTILEIVVVMVITGIVMGLGYSGYLLIQKSSYNNQEQQQKINDIARLKGLMDYLFHNADEISWNSDQQKIEFDDSESVMFLDSIVLFEKGVTDTLWIETNNFKPEEINNSKGELLLSSFEMELSELETKMSFSKVYSDYEIKGLTWN